MSAPAFSTRRPSNLAPWPFINISGTEKSGKSFSALSASASDLIGRTFVMQIGVEDDGDQYGAIPGARFELVEVDDPDAPDGKRQPRTYEEIRAALAWASEQPRGDDGKPNLLVLDSGTELWNLLSDEGAAIAQRRFNKKQADGKTRPGDEPQITMDLWNVAKSRWAKAINILRSHDGPALITTRLDEVAVLDNAGRPTNRKDWKVQAEKTLPYAVTGTVQFRQPRQALIVGMKSVRLDTDPDGAPTRFPNFTVDALWRAMGLEDSAATETRRVAVLDAAAGADEMQAAQEQATREEQAERAQASRPPQGQRPQQQRPVQQQRQAPPADALPASELLYREIAEVAGDRAGLVALRDRHTVQVLAQVPVRTRQGQKDAATVVATLIDGIDARARQQVEQPVG